MKPLIKNVQRREKQFYVDDPNTGFNFVEEVIKF